MGKNKRRPHIGGCTCRRCEPNGRGQPQVLGDVGGSTWSPRASEPPQHGYTLDGSEPHEVSFKHGGPTGNETLISDGHVDKTTFDGVRGNKGHDHYGSGHGENDNGTRRGRYTGPNR